VGSLPFDVPMNPPPILRVTLYSKPGCHLCEAVGQVIAAAGRKRAFELVVRDIRDDPADFERYQHAIPVVLVGGTEVARYRLTEPELLAALDRPG
jgi:glutaredoxin